MPQFVVELAVTVDDPEATDDQVKEISGYIQLEILEHEEEEGVWGLASYGVKAGAEWLMSWRSRQPDLLTAVTRGIEHAREACRKRGITTLRIVAVMGRQESEGS